ncbi:6-bladed beta-propeller [Bacteroides fragilis]|nr:6-bladed beta-propeller [Bacteroides fragilis]
MKQIFLFLFIFLLTSCISGGAKQDQIKVIDRTIRIGDAMEHPVPMKLSAFVDSITYIPLETTKSYVKDKMLIFYMKPYWIVYPGSLFDEEGRFVANIGALGQGP